MNTKMQMKQEEMNRSRQFEERIEVLQAGRNDLQIKVTKQNADISDMQSRLASSEREAESLKRQCNDLKQAMDSRDTELQNERKNARLEIESERKNSLQLRNKLAEIELRLSEQEKRAKDDLAHKDVEISYLKSQLADKEQEIARNRNDEIRRTELLETALQGYLDSARKAR